MTRSGRGAGRGVGRGAARGSGKGSERCGIVTVIGHLWWLDHYIRPNLGPKNLAYIKKSCFRHLFDIEEMQFQGQLLLHLLRKIDKSSEDRNCIAFHFNNQNIEFGREEFAVMSGLRFNELVPLPEYSDFHWNVFHGRENVKFHEIEMKFLNEAKDSGGDSELSLKLALLYVVFGLLLIRDRTSENIEIKYLHLIDDLEAFNNYPWGRVAYDFLVTSIHAARTNHDNLLVSGKQLKIDLCGLVSTIQTWAYEVIHGLANGCAVRVQQMANNFPRMIRWSASSYLTYDQLRPFFGARSLGKVAPLMVDEHERQIIQMLGIDQVNEGSPALCVKPKRRKLDFSEMKSIPLATRENEKKLSTLRRRKKAHMTPGNTQDREQSSPTPDQHSPAVSKTHPTTPTHIEEFYDSNFGLVMLSDILKVVKGLEARLDDYKCMKCGVSEPSGVKKNTFPTMNAPKSGGCVEKTPMEVDVDLELLLPSKDINQLINDCNSLPMKTPPISKHNAFDLSASCPLNLKHTSTETTPRLLQSVVVKSRQPRMRKSFQPRSSLEYKSSSKVVLNPYQYDPNESDYPSLDVESFSNWLHMAKKGIPPVSLLLPTKVSGQPAWFETIWDRSESLEDDHIDALINLLNLRYLAEPHRYYHGWTSLEQICWGALTQEDFPSVVEKVMPYVRGSYPNTRGLAWLKAKKIYGVGHVNTNHWVCYEVSTEEQMITVYDSLTLDWENVVSPPFRTMARFIPWILRTYGIWERMGFNKSLETQWQVVQFQSTPQQVNCTDCGILAFKFMECLVSGQPLSSLDPDRCAIYRRSLCGQLYNFSMKCLEKNDF